MKTIEFYPPSEAAFILRLALGPCRNWHVYLADLRRGKQRSGPQLQPYGRSDWKGQPLYAKVDVEKFVADFRQYCPEEVAKSVKPLAQVITVAEPKSWRDKVLTATSTTH